MSPYDELNEIPDQTTALIQGVPLGIVNANIAFHVYPYHALARMGWLYDPLGIKICWHKGWGHQQPNLPNSHRISWFQRQGSYTITKLSQDTARTGVSPPFYLLLFLTRLFENTQWTNNLYHQPSFWQSTYIVILSLSDYLCLVSYNNASWEAHGPVD